VTLTPADLTHSERERGRTGAPSPFVDGSTGRSSTWLMISPQGALTLGTHSTCSRWLVARCRADAGSMPRDPRHVVEKWRPHQYPTALPLHHATDPPTTPHPRGDPARIFDSTRPYVCKFFGVLRLINAVLAVIALFLALFAPE
jgi:hypothetical protein